MTIQDLAELYEAQTGSRMTRQNLSQRLRRDNFPEQDMHTLAAILGYQVTVQLTPLPEPAKPQQAAFMPVFAQTPSRPEIPNAPTALQITTTDGSTVQIPNLFRKSSTQGEINPLTGHEYLTNTVRRHPKMPNYVQVYDRSTHEWTEVNEDYFWEFQEKKKEILGADYQEPILI